MADHSLLHSTASKLVNQLRWLDSDQIRALPLEPGEEPKTELGRWFPFVFLHAGCLAVVVVGWSPVALYAAIAAYVVRMFAITGFYHRYFSHRSFTTSRAVQLIFAILGLTAIQRGPLWWAAHHRNHHRYSDKPGDIHSPITRSFLWSHIGWITSSANMPTDYRSVHDFESYPELRFLNRFDWLIPLLFAGSTYAAGMAVEVVWPASHTSGWQMLVWVFFISTTVLFHATASINSFNHILGTRRYDTGDGSRNNPILALLTLGEGWHNNHHHFSHCARQGFFWWELDITYYGLKLLQMIGLIHEIKPLPPGMREQNLLSQPRIRQSQARRPTDQTPAKVGSKKS